jgi:hypothetical protein
VSVFWHMHFSGLGSADDSHAQRNGKYAFQHHLPGWKQTNYVRGNAPFV